MILQFYLTECLWIINLIYNFRFLNFIENVASEASVNCFQNKEHFQNSLVIARNEAIKGRFKNL